MRSFCALTLGCLLPLFAQTYSFSDGGSRVQLDYAPHEVYVSLQRGADRQAVAGGVKKALGARIRSVADSGRNGLLVTMDGPAGHALFSSPASTSPRSRIEGMLSAAPVFYAHGEDSGSRHRPGALRLMTNRLLVRLDDANGGARWNALLHATKALSRRESLLGKPWMTVEYGTPFDALDASLWMLGRGGWEFTPVFAREYPSRQAIANAPRQRPVNDPLFPKQWHLADDGPSGIRMRAAWDVATGRNINVAVVDDGVDIAHEDLSGAAYPMDTGFHRNFNDGDPADPSPSEPGQTHGTNCAGLIAATGFNDIGVIGVAPEARLMGLRLIAGPAADDSVAEALAWQPNGLVTHVSSNSWGPADDGKDLGRMGALQRAALARATSTYRDGLGAVFCVSAGNGRANGDDASYDGFSSSRFVIGVGAVNRAGEPSSFSEQGINVAISALGGEFDPPGVIWTTNNSGPRALAVLHEKFENSEAPMHYSDAFNGTSAAAPQVSGAAALLLQHNPRLSYRDVKEILMRSATRTGLKNGDAFRENGGGLFFSHSFGAGLLNVSAALDLAAKWSPLAPLSSVALNSGDLIQRIPDGSIDGAEFAFDFAATTKLRVESVEVTVNVEHALRADIGFIIQSPSGMLSVAENRAPDDGPGFDDFLLTSVRHWGEHSAGKWTVRVVDVKDNGIAGRAGAITMRLHGTAQ